ncbi:hypothetical protein V1478_016461, partial [Vespula squamosa]
MNKKTSATDRFWKTSGFSASNKLIPVSPPHAFCVLIYAFNPGVIRMGEKQVSEVPRGILSSLGFLHPGGRQVAYLFLCDCVFNFKQVGLDKTHVIISTQEWEVPSPDIFAKFQQILKLF